MLHNYQPNHILVGLDVLQESGFEALKTNQKQFRKIAVLCHAASINAEGKHITQVLFEHHIQPVCFFGPEHGIWGTAQDMEAVTDQALEYYSKAPIYSLYGHTVEELQPKESQLEGVDCLLIDLQDIGARYYTYIYTATLCMQACAKLGIEVIVLDRPNPLGGEVVEGNLITAPYFSFVGLWPLPTRHGLTLGEVLHYFNDLLNIHAKLQVIKVSHWKREYLLIDHDQTLGQPSPNMPSFSAMLVYPGMCLIEGTELSEGRGTTRPFEWVGADFIQPFEFAEQLNQLGLDGIYFRPIYYKPTFHKLAHQSIGGIELRIHNPYVFKPLKTGLFFLATLRKQYGSALQWRSKAYEFVDHIPAIDLLFGTDQGRLTIDSMGDVEALWQHWQKDALLFKEQRKPYLLYSI